MSRPNPVDLTDADREKILNALKAMAETLDQDAHRKEADAAVAASLHEPDALRHERLAAEFGKTAREFRRLYEVIATADAIAFPLD